MQDRAQHADGPPRPPEAGRAEEKSLPGGQSGGPLVSGTGNRLSKVGTQLDLRRQRADHN